MTLTITTEGDIVTLYDDRLHKLNLGRMSMRRASHVEFNAASQEWEVSLPDHTGEVLFTHPDRATCLAWEREYFTERL
jgi:hypothetical protein